MTLNGNAEAIPNLSGTGIGGNLFNLVDVAPAYDFNPAMPTPPFQTCYEADGEGNVNGRSEGSAHFHFDHDRCEGEGDTESVDEQDPGAHRLCLAPTHLPGTQKGPAELCQAEGSEGNHPRRPQRCGDQVDEVHRAQSHASLPE